MQTNTTQYKKSHGIKPKGRGSWIFRMTGTDGAGRFTTYTGEASGTLTEARKQIASDFKAEVSGITEIIEAIVLP